MALERDLVIGLAVYLDRLRRRRRSRSLRPSHELHSLGNHFDHGSLLAVLGFPVARLQAALDQDRAPLVEVFSAALGLLSPHDDVQEAGILSFVPTLCLISIVHG